MTIKTVLEHSAGFAPDPKFFEPKYDEYSKNPNHNDYFANNPKDALKQIINFPLQYTPGSQSVYSDVDYMILGFIVQKITGQTLDDYVEKEIYKPLNLNKIVFNPLKKGFDKKNIAATELNGNSRDGRIIFKNDRKGIIQGQVHDEKAYYTMQGISGHAGLFSNATDLAKLAYAMIDSGKVGDTTIFNQQTIDTFTAPTPHDQTFGLGWRRQGIDKEYSSLFSIFPSTDSIGHTGWTGTLTIIDPVQKIVLVYLTNSKNSPVVGGDTNPNIFAGNNYYSSKYANIAALSFLGAEKISKNTVDNFYLSQVETFFSDVSDVPNIEEEYTLPLLNTMKKSLKAQLSVIESAKNSVIFTNFINSDNYKILQNKLQ
jgi:CubicO group peptidase (beta-lactamase class C family)